MLHTSKYAAAYNYKNMFMHVNALTKYTDLHMHTKYIHSLTRIIYAYT